MKLKKFATALALPTALLGTAACAEATSPRDYAIVFPQDLGREKGRETVRAIELFQKTVAPGSRISLFDGTALKLISRMKIPVTDNEAERYNATEADLNDFKRFAGRHWLKRGTQTVADETINIAGIADHLNLAFSDGPAGSREICTLIIGSTVQVGDPAFSMSGGRIPSDGLIAASRDQSPVFGTGGRGNLSGFSVNILTSTEASSRYGQSINRVWHLFFGALNAGVATYTSDAKIAWERFASCQKRAAATEWNETRNITAMIESEAPAHPTPAPERQVEPPTTTPAPPVLTQGPGGAPPGHEWLTAPIDTRQPPAPRVENAISPLIGIRWDASQCRRPNDVDLDIHVQTAPGRPWIYFGGGNGTAGGMLREDLRQPPAEGAHEFVELKGAVDLRELTILVNVWEGACANGVSGVVRALVSGSVYETPFTIKANGSLGRGGREGKAWIKIPVATLFRFGA